MPLLLISHSKLQNWLHSLKGRLPAIHRLSEFLVVSPIVVGFFLFLVLYIGWWGNDSNIKGILEYEKGNYEAAIEYFDEYIMLHDNDVKSYYNRGKCFEKLDLTEKAIEDYKRVLDFDPDHVKALLSCAQLLYKNQAAEEAVYFTEHAVLVDKNNYLAHYYNGRAHHKLGDVGNALESYNHAISLNPEFGHSYFHRSSIFLSIGLLPFGCEDLRKAESYAVPGAGKAFSSHCIFTNNKH